MPGYIFQPMRGRRWFRAFRRARFRYVSRPVVNGAPAHSYWGAWRRWAEMIGTVALVLVLVQPALGGTNPIEYRTLPPEVLYTIALHVAADDGRTVTFADKEGRIVTFRYSTCDCSASIAQSGKGSKITTLCRAVHAGISWHLNPAKAARESFEKAVAAAVVEEKP